jgi:hypothetical protein
MFPLSCVEELGFNRSSSMWWLRLKTQCECEFQNANMMVFCGEHMSCKIQKGNILDSNGWKLKPVVHKTLFLSINYRGFFIKFPPNPMI